MTDFIQSFVHDPYSIYSRFSSNSEANASELPETLEKNILHTEWQLSSHGITEAGILFWYVPIMTLFFAFK